LSSWIFLPNFGESNSTYCNGSPTLNEVCEDEDCRDSALEVVCEDADPVTVFDRRTGTLTLTLIEKQEPVSQSLYLLWSRGTIN
jgi:hypothetical protein